ncbi:glycerophosphodiester phosphodiesterase [Alteromonas confluentis]|uniref:Glycerophosphodiester phosphodiesterase n=1 Tax=Alteromonas confluentis TaxID=1656094 RepID=A0A1E7Z8A0_9ALTE|nr:glycerophosphodiester phosphodiesterase family protein [Alteromonas confluentis]OFC69750.1 glycerophosphodiester phosphodiesterase [Alteromonas confluentis]
MFVLAHRGASKAAPENTLAAFRLGFEMGAHGLEFDTYQVDGEIVVIHDRWLNRTTNGSGRVVDQTLSYLRSLNAGNGEPIPLLVEALQCLPESTLCNVEIKGMTNPESWLARLLECCDIAQINPDSLLISSFNHRWLLSLKQLRPTLKLGALTANIELNSLRFARELAPWSVNYALDTIEETEVKRAQEAGYKVLVYTVDNPEDMLLLQSWGVDGIFTNKPDLALATLK